MTKSGRGDRRREQFVDVGVELLTEGGWQAVTTRAVAERAGANLGLIHYHFGGVANLHTAIARRAGELVINPVLAELFEAADETAALDAVRRLLPATTGDPGITRLAAELVSGATRDPALREVFRDQLRQAREDIAERLGRAHPDWPERRRTGAATLAAALLDGLMLHRMIDPDTPVDPALDALAELVRS
ncbi:TetR/AcrR family transcriptional regulator [Saccharopolyspora taberi]|uniref:TetR family transcriptional regulator n=1 Tax=Saccharopolyspora taberi TaxID=60895 RepID=A0ABN3V2P9_9PSEU